MVLLPLIAVQQIKLDYDVPLDANLDLVAGGFITDRFFRASVVVRRPHPPNRRAPFLFWTPHGYLTAGATDVLLLLRRSTW